MKRGFFSMLFTALIARIQDRKFTRHERRRIIADPKMQAQAMDAGVRRRLEMHRAACLQGYRAKVGLVRDGVGRHTLAGIPKGFLKEQPQPQEAGR